MTIDLPTLSAAAAALAISFYVVLDGFDLGVGGLLLTAPNEHLRFQMIDTIEPTWDSNETWLVMAGLILLGAFPVAYSVLLPALYIPLIVMLVALGCRGVSFEFRAQPGSRIHLWDRAFCWGSLVAGACQGIIVGAMLAGIHVENGQFAGSALDVLRPYPVLMGLVLLSGYLTAGAAWIVFRTTGPLADRARRQLRILIPAFAALGTLAIALSPIVQPGVGDRWRSLGPRLIGPLLGFLTALAMSHRSLGRRNDFAPLAFVAVAFISGLSGLVAVVYPDIVPFRISLWNAASPASSQVFLLIGVACVMPVIIAYSAFAYYVFRGKVESHDSQIIHDSDA